MLWGNYRVSIRDISDKRRIANAKDMSIVNKQKGANLEAAQE